MATRRLFLVRFLLHAATARAPLSILGLLVLGLGCVQDDGGRFNPFDFGNMSIEQERELGAAFDAEVQKKLPVVDDPVVLGVVNDLGQAIVRQVEPQPFIYRFRVIVDPSLNAFAVPGGYIYLHSGTVLSAGSVDELAGVLAHEIGHVKGRHIARLTKDTALPNLLTNLAGIAASVATGEPGFAATAQAVNVAVQIQFTRELENEADQTGTIFMARAGHDPAGMVRFFERIIVSSARSPLELPPYLYSHPELDDRMETVTEMAENLRLSGAAPAVNELELRVAQARLAFLIQQGRTNWPRASTPTARTLTEPLVIRARELGEAERPIEALALLEEAEALDPADPRLPFHRAEILEQMGRTTDAIAAYRRNVALDPTHALVFYRLGLAYKASGDRVRAVYYLDQASRRFAEAGPLQRKADWEILKLTFPVILRSGLADGSRRRGADTVAGFSREDFSSSDARIAWWGSMAPRWVPRREEILVRWIDPSGEIVQELPAEARRKPKVSAVLELTPDLAQRHGVWRVQVLFEGDVVDEQTFHLRP